MNKKLGTKEQVKRGLLPIADAMNLVDPESKTYGWLKRRAAQVLTKAFGSAKGGAK
jgi:hypothetical protein